MGLFLRNKDIVSIDNPTNNLDNLINVSNPF